MRTLPTRHDFVAFERNMRRVADEWPGLKPEEVDRAKMTPYAAASNTVVRQMKDLAGHSIHNKMTNLGAEHGSRVIGRYCHIAALVANREGFDKNELVAMLDRDSSFEPLGAIASLQDDVAYRVEVDMGIGTYILRPEHLQPYVDQYQVGQDGGLEVPSLDEIIINKVAEIALEGRLENGKMCPAHANRLLQPIYRHFVRICANDPILFDQTLATRSYPASA